MPISIFLSNFNIYGLTAHFLQCCIIATCRSTKHADSTADELIRRLKKVGIKCPNPEGRPKCDWIIVDAGSVLVHLFRQEIRDLYNLEKLWEFNFDSSETKLA